MLTQRNVCILWLLLLLCGCGGAFKLDLFKSNPAPQEGDVRLFGSGSASEGRVEIYHEGKWGTVCDDGWDMAEAQVVCRQLHFPGAKSVVIGKDYGEVSGPIWLDDMTCKGTEDHLSTCEFKNWGVTDCSHKEDVGVVCETNNQNVTIVDSTNFLDHSIGLSDDLGQIFDSQTGCDFMISVQSPTGNRQEDGSLEMAETTICVHKMILSQFPLFNASEGINSITVSVSQACQPHFTPFIRYIYTRKIDVTFSSVQCIHWLASKFGVKQLMEDTGRLFTKILPEDTLFHTQVSIYKYAEETGDLVLQENCIQYLAWNFQKFAGSPAWTSLPEELLSALLTRSDLVVPDEYFLLKTVETWITEKGSSISLKTQADLLSRIRFPMIPAEKLYELELNSSLHSNHMNMYRENILKAFQFNVLLFSNLQSNQKFKKDDSDYQSRIYTAEPWSIAIYPSLNTPTYQGRRASPSYNSRMRYSSSYGHYYYYTTVSPKRRTMAESFSTPVHNSLIFKDKKIRWEANVFRRQQDCSNRGLRCTSLPMAELVSRDQLTYQSNILFRNKLLVTCEGATYVCQVQDFKVNLAHITVNGTHVVAYPCPGDQYIYRFVVRPEYF